MQYFAVNDQNFTQSGLEASRSKRDIQILLFSSASHCPRSRWPETKQRKPERASIGATTWVGNNYFYFESNHTYVTSAKRHTADFSYEKKTMQFLEYFVKVSQCCYYGQYIRCPKAIVGLLTQIASCVLGPLFMKFRVAFFYSLLGENILVNYL